MYQPPKRVVIETLQARVDALETTVHGKPCRRLSKSDVAKREGVNPRTIDRRVAEGKLPPSDDIISARHYWWEDTLERWRRPEPDSPEARDARNPRLRRKPARKRRPRK